MGGRRDSNPQQPEPQSGALPLSYGHQRLNEIDFKIPGALCKQRARLPALDILIVSASEPDTPQPVGYPPPSRLALRGGFAGLHIFLRRNERRGRTTG
jgi:hypothetical protein